MILLRSQDQIREVKFNHFKHIHCYEMLESRTKEQNESEFDFVYSNVNMTRMLKVAERYCWWAWNTDFYELLNWTLGWNDFQMNDYFRIERWWEIVFCAYLVASLWANRGKAQSSIAADSLQKSMTDFPFRDRLRRQVEIKY